MIPASVMSRETKAMHKKWLETPGKGGRPHKNTTVRVTFIPPATNQYAWDISPYENAWDLIEEKLAD